MGPQLLLAIPIFDKLTVLDAVGPYEILAALPNVDVVFVSHKPGAYSDVRGFLSLNATASFDDVPHPDIIMIPGGLGLNKLLNDRPLIDWLLKAHETSIYTTSVCTGSLLLGAAGLLKGVRATTHWSCLEDLAKYGAEVTESRVVIDDKIITAAGVSAGIDMGLKIAALLSGDSLAKTAQLLLEYDPQPPFDYGSVKKAGPEIAEKARSLMQSMSIQAYH